MPGYGESHLKRGRAVRPSSTMRLADERDDNLGARCRWLPGSGKRWGTQKNIEKLAKRRGPASARTRAGFQAGQNRPPAK